MKTFLMIAGVLAAMALSVAFPVAATLVSLTVLGSLGVAGGFAAIDARRSPRLTIDDLTIDVLSHTHPSESK
jgi:hypothetical protein